MACGRKAQRGIPEGFPPGRRTPRGRMRWYLVHAPKGREQSTCDKVRSIVSPDVLDDAFVLRKERWRKVNGTWLLRPVEMYEEYFFVVTRDVVALDRALSKLSFPARVLGSEEHAYVPLAADAQEWFTSAMDGDHVVRNSTAVIEDGQLHVQEGPLSGQEARVRKIDRHHRECAVQVCSQEGFTALLPMEVPFKS